MSAKQVGLVGGAIALGAAVYGLATETGFWPNLLAEIAGIAVGVAIGVTLLESVLDRRRKEHWSEVRLAINYRLGTTAFEFARELRRALSADQQERVAEERDPRRIASQLRILADELEWEGGAPAGSEPARRLRHQLSLMQKAVRKSVARLEGAAAEPRLVASMNRLDDALDSEILTQGTPDDFLPWNTVMRVAETFADVLDQIFRPEALPSGTVVRFKIGEAFPADDPIARFVTVLGMMSNDWLRSISDMLTLDDEDADTAGRRVALFRQQAALHHEAATFIADARRRFPEIDAFIKNLDKDAQAECAALVGGIDPRSSHYHGEWLARNRHLTFHYPEMHPDKAAHGNEEITEALRAAAALESTITAEAHFGSVRFGFADEVAVQWLPDAQTQVELIAALREAVMALARFAQRAARAYLEARPAGTIRIE